MQNPYPQGTLERLHTLQLKMLQTFDELCLKHGLTYFLDGGTCLGAVRHQGFIPWDDDVDLGMPKEDYEWLCRHAKEVLPEGLSLRIPQNTQGQAALWAKLSLDGTCFIDQELMEAGCEQAIFCDIFPYVRLEKDTRLAAQQIKSFNHWQKVSYLHKSSHIKIPHKTPAKRLVTLGIKGAHAYYARRYTSQQIQTNFQSQFNSKNPGDLWVCPSYATYGSFTTEILFPTIEYTFEEITLRVPHKPQEYLNIMYGPTWTEFPPLEDRYTHAPKILDFGDGINVMED